MEASKASISLLLVPVIGVVSGVLFLDEKLGMITVGGIMLVLLGIWLVNGKSRTKHPELPLQTGSEQQSEIMK
ncbi:EamA family transporter [Paenibacillus chibensis]|uniref:EamA family transporter n=1 Tax=Paenibacillus chibensis TaxID=59846 RepID=UPI002DB8388E|nr:EamA family transporter [Paenibacillus chibensis]MEC0371012.1 EamA family transporter [Paenibacillus chibensis]